MRGSHIVIQCSSIGIFEDDIVGIVAYKTAIERDDVRMGQTTVPESYEGIAFRFEVESSIRSTICFQGENIRIWFCPSLE